MCAHVHEANRRCTGRGWGLADRLLLELGPRCADQSADGQGVPIVLEMVLLCALRAHECVRRADSSFRDCYLTMVGEHFPITAHLCGSDDRETSVLVCDIVFSMLEQ